MTKNVYYRYQIVQIYDTDEAGDYEWYMVGPGEWIDQRQIAIVHPDSERPEGFLGDRWISVNLYELTIAAYDEGELVFASLVCR